MKWTAHSHLINNKQRCQRWAIGSRRWLRSHPAPAISSCFHQSLWLISVFLSPHWLQLHDHISQLARWQWLEWTGGHDAPVAFEALVHTGSTVTRSHWLCCMHCQTLKVNFLQQFPRKGPWCPCAKVHYGWARVWLTSWRSPTCHNIYQIEHFPLVSVGILTIPHSPVW